MLGMESIEVSSHLLHVEMPDERTIEACTLPCPFFWDWHTCSEYAKRPTRRRIIWAQFDPSIKNLVLFGKVNRQCIRRDFQYGIGGEIDMELMDNSHFVLDFNNLSCRRFTARRLALRWRFASTVDMEGV